MADVRVHAIFFGAFMCVLVPVYCIEYGPKNFLYFCDTALLITLSAFMAQNMQLERLLLSSALDGILLPQLIWCVDFIQCYFGYYPITGIAKYMFDSKLSKFLRTLSFFHFWLPWFLLFSVTKVGYDPNGFYVWLLVCTVNMITCYFVSPAPGGPPQLPRNINKVFGPSDETSQDLVHPLIWLIFVTLAGPVLSGYVSHSFLQRLFAVS
jgi:hypothetical protein